MGGGRLGFPREPMFLCDFHPDYAQYLALGQAGRHVELVWFVLIGRRLYGMARNEG